MGTPLNRTSMGPVGKAVFEWICDFMVSTFDLST